MNKKSLFIFASFTLLLLLTACNGSSSDTRSGFGYVGGAEGLVASFVDGEPPTDGVYDADSNFFRISLQLENKGEYSVEIGDLMATLVGVSYDQFQIKEGTLKNVAPISKARLEGGSPVYTGVSTDISYEAKYKNRVPANQDFELGINYCYRYQTDATADVCLRKDPTQRPEESDKCQVEGEKTVGSSGAPVQVTSLLERPSGQNTVQLLLTIENKGLGDVYDRSYLGENTECIEVQDKKGKVYVKVSFDEDSPKVTCDVFNGNNEGTLNLVNNKQTLLCRVDTTGINEPAAFTQRPNILLDYVYKEHMGTSVLVQKSF